MPPPSFLYGFAKSRKPGRFAWHPEALISPRIRREETPRLLRRIKRAYPFQGISRPMLPVGDSTLRARIALASGPRPRWGRRAGQGERPSRTLNRGPGSGPRGNVEVPRWNGGELGISPPGERSPPDHPGGVTPLFRVREGPSPRPLQPRS